MWSILSVLWGEAGKLFAAAILFLGLCTSLYVKGRFDAKNACQMSNWAIERDILRAALEARNAQRAAHLHPDELFKNDGYLRPSDPMFDF